MKRAPLIQLIQNYFTYDHDELECKAQMLDFIGSHADCFERSLAVGHMTASAWLLNEEGSQALLMHHAKLGLWVQPGGHADGNPNLLEVALKEAREESGLNTIVPISTEIFDLAIHLIPENEKERAHYHYDVRFLLRALGPQEVKGNEESHQLLWIDKKATTLPTDQPSVIRLFTKWLVWP